MKKKIQDQYELFDELHDLSITTAQRKKIAIKAKELIELNLDVVRLLTELSQAHGLMIGDIWLHEANSPKPTPLLRLVQS